MNKKENTDKNPAVSEKPFTAVYFRSMIKMGLTTADFSACLSIAAVISDKNQAAACENSPTDFPDHDSGDFLPFYFRRSEEFIETSPGDLSADNQS